MASGASFLAAIGIIRGGIRGRAISAIMDFRQPSGGRLSSDICRKIDFIVRWTNAGRDLHDDVAGVGLDRRAECGDGLSDDAEVCSLASRVG